MSRPAGNRHQVAADNRQPVAAGHPTADRSAKAESFRKAFPLCAAIADDFRKAFGPDLRLTYANEAGQQVGQPDTTPGLSLANIPLGAMPTSKKARASC